MIELRAADRGAGRTCSLSGTDVNVLIERGHQALKRRGLSTAVAICTGMLAQEAGRMDLLDDWGGLLGRQEAAVTYLARAVRVLPGHLDALCNRGVSLNQLRRHEAALQIRPGDSGGRRWGGQRCNPDLTSARARRSGSATTRLPAGPFSRTPGRASVTRSSLAALCRSSQPRRPPGCGCRVH